MNTSEMSQIERIFFAIANNQQVSWIAADLDVKSFISRFETTARGSVANEILIWVANMMDVSPHFFDEEVPF